jgi:hypothetical protein
MCNNRGKCATSSKYRGKHARLEKDKDKRAVIYQKSDTKNTYLHFK